MLLIVFVVCGDQNGATILEERRQEQAGAYIFTVILIHLMGRTKIIAATVHCAHL